MADFRVGDIVRVNGLEGEWHVYDTDPLKVEQLIPQHEAQTQYELGGAVEYPAREVQPDQLTLLREAPATAFSIGTSAAERKAALHQELRLKLAQRVGFYAAATAFIGENPVHYDKNGLWWLWNPKILRWELTDETDILLMVREVLQLLGDTTVRFRSELLEALRQNGRKHKPIELPVEWIQFADQLHNIKTGEVMKSTPSYFSTNVIPWKVGASTDTPVMDQLFVSWVGAERAKTLYEVIAYACVRDYPLHLIIVLNGSGRNGKTTFLRLLSKFIGKENIVATDLDRLIKNNFETFNLYKKLIAQMGETDVSTLQSTSLIKRLSGQDMVPFECKGKTSFTDMNYAKLLIATNSLPSSEDTSEGYYRRWLIIDFPHEFPEGRDILQDVPAHEFENLAAMVIQTLPELLARGSFTGQGTIEERRRHYIEASNPLEMFIEEQCDTTDPNATVDFQELHLKYTQWLISKKKRVVKKKEFSTALEAAGFEHKWTSVNYLRLHWVFGVKCVYSPSVSHGELGERIPVSSLYVEPNSELLAKLAMPATASINGVGEINEYADIVAWFRSHPDDNVAIDDFVVRCSLPDAERFVTDALRSLQERGDIFAPKPGLWRWTP